MISLVIVASCLICFVFLSMFDDFGIAGVVPLIQNHYSLSDAETAIIKTSPAITNTATLLLIRLFLTSVSIWTICSLLAVLLGSGSFMIFILFRSITAAASASFSVLVPVIMTDLFQDRHLGIALMSINIAGLVAIMVSVTFGSWVVSSGSPWQSGLIVPNSNKFLKGVPLIAIVPLLCLLWAKNNLRNVQKHDKGIAKIFVDALSILSIKSFILLSATYSLTNFATAAYNFWFPSMYLIIWDTTPDIFLGIPYTVVTILNSGAMIVGMAMGIPTLMWFAQSWRYGTGLFEGRNEYLRAYPIVVSAGSSLNAASFILSIIMLDRSYLACLIFFHASTFFVGIGTAADASLSQQMMLMVVPSSERAAAIALSRLISSIVGIPSAQIVGLIADLIRGDSTLPSDRFHAYQLASLCASSLLIASVICFLLLAFSFNLDCEKAKEIKDKEEEEEADERTALIEKEALLSKE